MSSRNTDILSFLRDPSESRPLGFEAHAWAAIDDTRFRRVICTTSRVARETVNYTDISRHIDGIIRGCCRRICGQRLRSDAATLACVRPCSGTLGPSARLPFFRPHQLADKAVSSSKIANLFSNDILITCFFCSEQLLLFFIIRSGISSPKAVEDGTPFVLASRLLVCSSRGSLLAPGRTLSSSSRVPEDLCSTSNTSKQACRKKDDDREGGNGSDEPIFPLLIKT